MLTTTRCSEGIHKEIDYFNIITIPFGTKCFTHLELFGIFFVNLDYFSNPRCYYLVML